MPEELLIALQCERFHALPVAGGILDQPSWLWSLIDRATDLYDEWRREKRQDEYIENAADRLTQEAIQNALAQKKEIQ